MDSVLFRQLLPTATTVDALTFVDGIGRQDADESAHSGPYTVVNFVASADGHAAVEGRSGKLGDAADKEIFGALRESADAVMAGTGTMHAERYGRMLASDERRARRVAAGRSAEPLAVTVTRSGKVPSQIPLFHEHDSEVVVFSPTAPALADASATIHHELLYAGGHASLTDALKVLHRKYQVELLLCEGGPMLFNALLHEGLVDELFLTVAPKLVGGSDGTGITSGVALVGLQRMRLIAVLEHDDALFLRYKIS